MRAADNQLVLVIVGLVLSAALISSPVVAWSAVLSLIVMSLTLIAFSAWVRTRAVRSRSVLVIGVACLLAATLWLEFVLSPIESPLRWLLSFALAWMLAPFSALALVSFAERLISESHR